MAWARADPQAAPLARLTSNHQSNRVGSLRFVGMTPISQHVLAA